MDKSNFIILCILIVLVVILGGAMILMSGAALKELNTRMDYTEQIQLGCHHEFAITSEYDFIMGSYRTISKCVKCGKTI